MRGEFFAIDRNSWAKVCELGMNPAVAYLVLACFSGRTNSTSKASTNAVEKYTGISRSRGKTAIQSLVKNGKISSVGTESKPLYNLLLPEKQELIWVPNAIVTGATDETPPVERLRQTQDVMALRLFVDLYYGQNLVEDGGIRRSIISMKYNRTPVHKCMEYSVWAFRYEQCWVTWDELTKPHKPKHPTTGANGEPNYGVDIFRRLGRLQKLGLIEWIPTVCESDSSESEPIFPCSPVGDPIETALFTAANNAARQMLTNKLREWVDEQPDFLILVPVPQHFENVALVGTARLRYRPQTKMTSKWLGELNSRAGAWTERFERVAEGRTGLTQKMA